VFIDIAVITVAPVALAVGRKAKLPVSALLVAMIGGGKAGNIISPNPNTIAAADAFKIELTSLMGANIIPAIAALVVTILLSMVMTRRAGDVTTEAAEDDVASATDLPSFLQAVIGPLTVVVLLALRPLFGIAVDPLVALPVGGLVCNLVTGRWRDAVANSEFGLSKVIGVSILLIGTGTIAGIVKDSGLNQDMIALLGALHLPTMALAPVSGFLMAGATASTTAGATIASQTFSGTLVSAGVPALASAAMIHAGATIIDSLPHGSFFHATGGAVGMPVKDRLKLIPYEAAVGLASTVVAVVLAACAR